MMPITLSKKKATMSAQTPTKKVIKRERLIELFLEVKEKSAIRLVAAAPSNESAVEQIAANRAQATMVIPRAESFP